MVEYTKKWLPLEGQVERLVKRGLEVDDVERAAALLKSIGYCGLEVRATDLGEDPSPGPAPCPDRTESGQSRHPIGQVSGHARVLRDPSTAAAGQATGM